MCLDPILSDPNNPIYQKEDKTDEMTFDSIFNSLSNDEKEIVEYYLYDLKKEYEKNTDGLKYRFQQSKNIASELMNYSVEIDNSFLKNKLDELLQTLNIK